GIMTVAIVLAIGLVVLALVRNQVGEREAVMGGKEIYTGRRFAPIMVELIGRSSQLPRQRADHSRLPLPELADLVAVAVVPFQERLAETAHMIAPRPRVPWLGDQQAILENFIGPDALEQCGIGRKTLKRTAQNRRQIEAKAGNSEFGYPVFQAIDNQILNRGMVALQR